MSVIFLCVWWGGGWEKPGGITEHKGTSEGAHRQHPYSPPPQPPLFLFHPPSSLLQSWACTLAVAPAAAAEARLLFKAALSFGLFSFFFSLPFFSADVNRVASQSSLPLTHLIYKTTKEGENERIEKEESQNKMGTARSSSLFSSHHICGVSGKEKTDFQRSPSFPNNTQIQVGSRDGLNVDQLYVGV